MPALTFDAVVFDLGNTLVPWTRRESAALFLAIQKDFEQACGPMPDFLQRVATVREQLIKEREDTTMREVTVDDMVRGLCNGEAPEGLIEAVTETTDRVFVDDLCRISNETREVIQAFHDRMPIAVLSNFYVSRPIERALRKADLYEKFAHVEVSATHGFAKPHPQPFDIVRETLDVPMERILMVGDEFWADIVGGHRAGFLTALTHEYRQGPTSDPRAPYIAADRVITSLRELL